MALLYKGVDFEYIETDPYDKNDAWMAVSRGRGQVPVLVDKTADGREISVPDSLRTIEYIEAKYADQGPSLYPKDPLEAADVNFWLDHLNGKVTPYFYRFLGAGKNKEDAEKQRRHYEDGLAHLAEHMSSSGPYFLGENVSVVDLALAPFVQRTEIVLGHYMDYKLPTSGETWTRFHRWWDAMHKFKPLVQSSYDTPDFTPRVIEFYARYYEGNGQTDVARVA